MAKKRSAGVSKDTASFSWRHVLFGGGVFDNTSPKQNKKGWEIFELEKYTGPDGELDMKRILETSERAVRSPKALRELFAAA